MLNCYGMEITYCTGGLVRVKLDGIDYELANAYELVKQRISLFASFAASQDVHYAAVLLTLEQHYPTRQRSDADQEVITRVNESRYAALNG